MDADTLLTLASIFLVEAKKGRSEKSMKKQYKTMAKGKEHPFTYMEQKFEKHKSKIKNPAGLAAHLKDLGKGTTKWRGKSNTADLIITKLERFAEMLEAEEPSKIVIVMRAIPGSGKSTLAKQLAAKAHSENKSALICSADDYFYELGNGQYAFDRNKIAEAHKYCFKKFMNAIQENVNLIIVDNTNLSAWEISPYKTYAEAFDYKFLINQVNAPQAEAFKRQQHGVPFEHHENMARGLEQERIPPWWEKENFTSKTSETGEPLFEPELMS